MLQRCHKQGRLQMSKHFKIVRIYPLGPFLFFFPFESHKMTNELALFQLFFNSILAK